jgi:pilus assembly protein FimV
MPGDTLASVAGAIYPHNPSARTAYAQAIRSENPALADLVDDAVIASGTTLVLPDLRKFSLAHAAAVSVARPRPTGVAPRPAAAIPLPAPSGQKADVPKPPAPKVDLPKPPAPKADLPKPPAPKAESKAPPAVPKADPRSAAGGFALKLSAPEIDLSRSRGVDERMRAQLRERRLVLDADDNVAALLAMRNTVKQLEGRVAELQLKLSTLQPSASSPVPASATAAAVAPAPAKATLPAAAPPAPSAPAPVPEPAPASRAPPEQAPAASPVAPATPDKAKPAVPAGKQLPAAPPVDRELLPAWLWGVLALLAAVIGGGAWWMRSKRHPPPPGLEPLPATPGAVSDLDEAEALMRAAGGPDVPLPAQARDHRVVAESDASLATHIPGADPVALRRRYIEERFPEIAGGTIAPGDPESVVKAARLLYEDGAVARAVELLQFAVEETPASMKPWLALFEIFRLEGLTGEFAELAGRFREHHAASDNWRKVQFIGREFDPQNPLYRDESFNSLETIGHPAPKRGPVTFDPLAENWLNAPMDFTTDALTSGLRTALLADAGLQESDLLPDPMPALKNVEMFNVA